MATTVQAASPYINIGSRTGNITISYTQNFTEGWLNVINNSIAAWNNSNATVSIRTVEQSKNTLTITQYEDTWYGMTTQYRNATTGCTSYYTIKENSRTIKRDATNYTSFARSTLVHEFGHVFWLCDNPATSRSSIMSYSRDRNTMTKPQSYDIENVNAKYQ